MSRACASCGESITTGSVCPTCREAQRPDYGYDDPEYQRNKRIALRRAGGRCEVCGDEAHPRDPLEVDHKVPRSKGGSHALENLRVAHRSFNLKRRNHAGFIRKKNQPQDPATRRRP